MNIFHRITLATLRKNRVRTTVTIIGILLSAAMFCAVTTLISSLRYFLLENMIYRQGSWHGSAVALDWEGVEQIAGSERVEASVYSQQLGYAVLESPQNEYKPYLYLIGAGEGFDGMLSVHLTAGRYPASPQELLLPEHLLDSEGPLYDIGDVLTLELGARELDGVSLRQETPSYTYDENGNTVFAEEAFVPRESRTYTVVGFYERPSFEPYNAPGYTALTLADSTPAAGACYDVYFSMRHPGDVYAFVEENGYGGSLNDDVLMLLGESAYDNFYHVLYGLAAIVMGLILFGSVSLIYNAFSISVSERTRQFGLLSSVGATRRQLRRSVLFEALVVSAIGIPLGILVGVGGIGVTLLCLGDRLSTVIGLSIPMRLRVSLPAVLAACAVALVTVLISAWIPSRRATRVTAVEAIRQNADVRPEAHPARSPGICGRLFGLPGLLAARYYRRSRKKYRSTVLSLFMSIVLFVSASAFTGYLTDSVEGGFDELQFDLEASVSGEDLGGTDAETMLGRLSAAAGISAGTYTLGGSLEAVIPAQFLSAQAQEWFPADGSVQQSVQICFVRDADFLSLLREYGLSEALFYNPQSPLALAFDRTTEFNPETQRFESIRLLSGNECEAECYVPRSLEGYTFRYRSTDESGNRVYVYENNADASDLLELPQDEACEARTLYAGVTLDEYPWFVNTRGALSLLYPVSFLEELMPEWREWNDVYSFLFTSEDHAASYDSMKTILQENGLGRSLLSDYAESVEQDRNVVTIVRVFSYGFIVLISLIAAANVFNTISTNISLRRREFAMLKSVGMSNRGFNRMMNYECLLYGTRALLWGLPVSALVTYLIYRVVDSGFETAFRLPWAAIGIAVLSVFAVVFVTMLYAMRKLKRDNPIDALKNENL